MSKLALLKEVADAFGLKNVTITQHFPPDGAGGGVMDNVDLTDPDPEDIFVFDFSAEIASMQARSESEFAERLADVPTQWVTNTSDPALLARLAAEDPTFASAYMSPSSEAFWNNVLPDGSLGYIASNGLRVGIAKGGKTGAAKSAVWKRISRRLGNWLYAGAK